MPVGTTLLTLRKMLNVETGDEMDETISPANVDINNQLLNNQQLFLANNHSYLVGKTRVELPAVVGTQYYDLPAGIDFDHLDKPEFTNVANFRYRLGFGIGQEEYNLFRSDLGVQASPVMKWDFVNVAGVRKIEMWPIPSVAQTIMFSGLLKVAVMTTDASVCVIDDMALVLYTAAENLAAKESPRAGMMAAKAKSYMDALKAAYPSKFERFNMAGTQPALRDLYVGNNRRPVVATN